MKKVIIVMVAIMSAIMPIGVNAAQFTDVPQSHWAYETVTELSEKGIIDGIGDGLYQPDGTLTRAQFVKLLSCAMGDYDENATYEAVFVDTDAEAWYTPYVTSGVYGGIIGNDGGYFYPENPMTRGEAAVWMTDGMGIFSDADCKFNDVKDERQRKAVATATAHKLINGYEDGTYKPENTLTRAEAATLIKRVMSSKAVTKTLRTDSANEVVMAENVKVIESGENNKISSSDAKNKTLTISEPDQTVTELKAGDILYIPQEDILVKVKTAKKSGSDIVLTCMEPELSDVIESIDISTVVAPDAEDIKGATIDGEPAKVSTPENISESAQKLNSQLSDLSAVSGAKIETDSDGDVNWFKTKNAEGKKVWTVYGKGSGSKTFNISTPSFKDKKGAYASCDVTMGVLVDFSYTKIKGEEASISLSADVITDVTSVVGYAKSANKDVEIELYDIEIPVAGPVKIVVTVNITAMASGEFKVEANANLHNSTGGAYSNGDFISWCDTEATATLDANAAGTLEIGPQVAMAVSVGKSKLLDIDGIELVEVSGNIGVGVNGSVDVNHKVSADSDGKANYESNFLKPDENGVIHDCYVCFKGDIYGYGFATIGLGSDINDELKSHGKKEVKISTPKFKAHISPWHFTTGGTWGSGPEFAMKECKHKLVRVTGKVRDKRNGDVISGALITTDGKNVTSTAGGKYELFAKPGRNDVVVNAEDYREYSSKMLVPSNKEIIFDIYMEPEKVKVSGRAYDSVTNEAVPGAKIVMGDIMVTADGSGYYEIELEPGDYGVSATTEGYYDYWKPITVGLEDMNFAIAMDPDPAYAARKAYAKFLGNMKNFKSWKFNLIYLDNNDIPELVTHQVLSGRIDQAYIYTYSDNKVTQIKWSDNEYASNGYGAYGTFGYKEKQGVISGGNGGHMGYWTSVLYSVDGTKATLLASGVETDTGTFTIDGTNVSKSYYQQVFNYDGFITVDPSGSYEINKSNIKNVLGVN